MCADLIAPSTLGTAHRRRAERLERSAVEEGSWRVGLGVVVTLYNRRGSKKSTGRVSEDYRGQK